MKRKDPEELETLFEEWKTGLIWILTRKDASDMWPLGITRSTAEFGHHFWGKLNMLKDLAEKKGLSLDILSQGVEFPTALSATATYGFFYARQFAIPLSERKDVLGWLIQIASAGKFGSLFNKDEKNLIYTPQELQHILKDMKFRTTTPELSQSLHYLSGLLWTYCELMYFFNHRIGTEKHGPYVDEYSPHRHILIRSCANLSPSELWKTNSELGFYKAELLLEYEYGEAKFDILSNIIHHEELVKNLCGYKLYLQRTKNNYSIEEIVDISEINEVISSLESLITSCSAFISTQTETELALKMEQICLYSLLPIAVQIGVSWEDLVSEYPPNGGIPSNCRYLFGTRGLDSQDLKDFCDIFVDV